MEDQRPVGGIGDLTQERRVVLPRLDHQPPVDIGVDVRRHLGEVACPPRLVDHGGEIAEVAGLHGQVHLGYAFGQPIGTPSLDFLLGQEADHSLDAEGLEMGHIVIAQPRQLAGAVDLCPLHRAAIDRLITAEIAEVRLAVESHVPGGRGRWLLRSRRNGGGRPVACDHQHHKHCDC